MKQTLKQLRINKDDPSFIIAATELKGKSKKRLGEILLVLFLLAMGIFFLGTFIYMIPLTITKYMNIQTFSDFLWLTFSLILFFPTVGIITFFTLGMGIYGLKDMPTWHLGLYKNRLVFHQFDETNKTYVEKIIPLSKIKGCDILKTEHVNYMMIKGRSFESVHYTISVHVEYEIDGKLDYIHLLRPDGFDQLNEIISFLQKEKQIPIYYIYAPGEMYNYETRNERVLIKQFERKPITFNGQLDVYSQREFLRKVNYFKALKSSSDYMEKKLNKDDKE